MSPSHWSGFRVQAAAMLLLAAAAMLAWPDCAVVRLKAWLDSMAPDGSAGFFSPARLRDISLAAAALLPCLGFAWVVGRHTRVAAPADAATRARRLPWVEVALATAVVLFGLARIHTDPPRTKDTKFYLSESLDAAAAGGPTGVLRGCFTGDYRHDNRHPFYPALLSAVAEPSDRFTERARLFSLLGALLAFALFVRLCRRAGGPDAAALGGALLAANSAFLDLSVSVACETWWMAFAILWFDHLTRSGSHRPVRHAAVAGAAAGLAWLTKGTGTLLLAAGALHLLWPGGSRRGASLTAYLLVFVVVGLPLAWRNTRVFGNPLWNINSSKVMWLDRWAEFHDPDAMARAGPLDYLRTHSAIDVGKRLAVGCVKQGVHLLGLLAPVENHAGVGMIVLCLVLLGLRRGNDPGRRRLLALLFVLYFAGFAWYSRVVSDGRFLAALVPLLLAPAALLRPRIEPTAPLRAPAFAAAGLALLLSLAAIAGGALDYRPDGFRPSPEAAAVHRFLREHIGANEHADYYLGPSERIGFDWDRRIRGARHPLPASREALARGAAEAAGAPTARIRFAVVEPGAPVATSTLRVWLAPDPHGGWQPEPPAGWTLVQRIPAADPRVFIFARSKPATP